MTPPHAPPTDGTAPHPPRHPRWRAPDTLRTVATVLVGAAAGWYLMLQLAPVLRPLLIAAFLAYVLMPYHARLRHQIGTAASLTVLAGSTAAVLVVFAFVTYASILALNDDVPQLQQRAGELTTRAERALAAHAPWALPPEDGRRRGCAM